MATCATRSASRRARVAEAVASRGAAAVATGPLGALSHDELGVIVDGLADPLQPIVAVALSSTCLGLRTPLRAALEVLKERHARAVALCRKLDSGYKFLTGAVGRDGFSCAALRDKSHLTCVFARWEVYKGSRSLNSVDMATLGTILPWMPKLEELYLRDSGIDNAGMQALCEGLVPLARGSMPALYYVDLMFNEIGPSGAEALAATLCKLPGLNVLNLGQNPFGDQGMAALAMPLRKLPHLLVLNIEQTDIGDDGLDSLLANLSKDDFKELEDLELFNDELTGAGKDGRGADGAAPTRGYAALASALVDGAMPQLQCVPLADLGARMAMADKADALEARGIYLHHV